MCILETMGKTAKWAIGVTVAFVVGLMGLQTTVMVNMNNNLIMFMSENAEQHRQIEKTVFSMDDRVDYIYKYEISPNTSFRKKHENKQASLDD